MASRKKPRRKATRSSKRPRRKTARAHPVRAVTALLGRIPVGPALFAIGISLGFGIGLALTFQAPSLLARLEREIAPPKPAVKPVAKPAEVAAVPPEIVEQAVVTPPPAPLPAAAPSPATPESPANQPANAEEGAHQSAPQEAVPVEEPAAEVAALPSPAAKEPDVPLWRQNAVIVRDPGDKPMIAIVLDDVGVAPQHAEMAIDLPAPIVLSIMTYAKNAAQFAAKAHAKGHEIMVHMPMQPVNASVNPGPNALTVGLDGDEIRRRVDWGLSRFSGFVGFNNHMGSRFTQDAAGMRVVLTEAKRRGLLFLDSKTIAGSVGDALAAQMGVTHIARDVFLDDDMSEAAVARQLAHAEAVAKKQGYAVAIGHPHPATLAVLRRWLVDAKARGFAIVPLTTIIKKREGVAG